MDDSDDGLYSSRGRFACKAIQEDKGKISCWEATHAFDDIVVEIERDKMWHVPISHHLTGNGYNIEEMKAMLLDPRGGQGD